MRVKNVRAAVGLSMGALLFLQGCGESAAPVKEPVRINVVDKTILLKELTTGIAYDTKIFPKPEFRFDGERRFKYQYFGEQRSRSCKTPDARMNAYVSG